MLQRALGQTPSAVVVLTLADMAALPEEQAGQWQGKPVAWLVLATDAEAQNLPPVTALPWSTLCQQGLPWAWVLTTLPAQAFWQTLQLTSQLCHHMGRLDALVQPDDLDELVNRRYWLRRLNDELALARRHKTGLSVVLLALDSYSFALDAYGYDPLNTVMRLALQRLARLLRTEDALARLGDNELALLLSHSNEASALGLLKRFKASLEATPIMLAAPQAHSIEPTLWTAGVVSWPFVSDLAAQSLEPNAPKPEALLRYARHGVFAAQQQLNPPDHEEEGELTLATLTNEPAKPLLSVVTFSQLEGQAGAWLV
jgi:diguanylate cyclase (GGDEF)-like protein